MMVQVVYSFSLVITHFIGLLISASSLTFNMLVNDMIITRDSSWTEKYMERNQTDGQTDQPKYTHTC